jgi:hypothetical protein
MLAFHNTYTRCAMLVHAASKLMSALCILYLRYVFVRDQSDLVQPPRPRQKSTLVARVYRWRCRTGIDGKKFDRFAVHRADSAEDWLISRLANILFHSIPSRVLLPFDAARSEFFPYASCAPTSVSASLYLYAQCRL